MSAIAEPPARSARAELDSAWIEEVLRPTSEVAWLLLESHEQPGAEQDIEARLAIGNGAFGLRASLEQSLLAARPAAFVAGLFDTSDREPHIPVLVAESCSACLQPGGAGARGCWRQAQLWCGYGA